MIRKHWLLVLAVLLMLCLVPSVAVADDGEQDNDDNSMGPYPGSSTDSGTCGPDWALDTFERVFHVKNNGNGTYTLREDFANGRFTTTAGLSPGACETSGPHGSFVLAGIKGRFHGFLVGPVSGGTFNENGTCATNPCTTAGFVLGFFGPTAQYSCVSGPGACSFKFEYHANDQGLIFRHWQNASPDLGGNLGDIASS